jgi:hypothetical protein
MGIIPGEKITHHEWGIVKLEVGVEAERPTAAPKRPGSGRGPLRIKVGEKDVPFYLMGSRAGHVGDMAYLYRTVGIPLGGPGPKKTITVMLDNLSRSISVDYNPSGQLDLMGLSDNQAIFGSRDVVINWLACYIVKDSIRLFVNGREVAPDARPVEERPELLEGRISVGQKLVAGVNTVTVEGVDIQGSRRKREISLHYYPDNRVRLGDAFVLNLGLEDAKNGPFYEAVVEGASLVKEEDFSGPPGPERIGGRLLVPEGKTVLARFLAVKPGMSIIRTREKQHAIDVPQEFDSVRVIVPGPPAGIRAGEVEGSILETYSARDLFTCSLPRGWYRAEDLKGNRRIYGVSTYKPVTGEEPGVKLSMEFYSPDSRLGRETAEEFCRGLLKGAPSGRKGGSGRISELTVAGRRAVVVERDVPGAPEETAPQRMRERFVVIPAEEGFYVLQFRASPEGLSRHGALFAAIIDSFRPLR